MTPEFALIDRYFTHRAPGALLGVGDDAALVRVRPGRVLAISADLLVEGTHFFPGADPVALGHKSLAVNLSDLAAMGATPRWALLSLALPRVGARWLAGFSRGFMRLARAYAVDLIGGDTTRGPLTIGVTILGEVAPGRALRRDGARAGDDVWVSGTLGDAALAVAHRLRRVRLAASEREACRRALDLPAPQVALGVALAGVAHAAIDVSDGLVADLGHVCERSGLAADVHEAAVPCSPALARRRDSAAGRAALLAGGDDYQLLFTAPVRARARVTAAARAAGTSVSRIGIMRAGRGVRVLDARGRRVRLDRGGFDHFG